MEKTICCDPAILSDAEAEALSKVLKMCPRLHSRRPLVPSFRKPSEQSNYCVFYYKNSFMNGFVLMVPQEANVSPPCSRTQLMEVYKCTEDAAQHFV